MLIFDIESESLPLEDLQAVCQPFDPSSIKDPGKFDPYSVKLGRMTDQTKIDAKIKAESDKHAEQVRKYDSDLAGGEAKHWADICGKAALYASTGSVCAIGYHGNGGKQTHHLALGGTTERTILMTFWKMYRDMQVQRRSMVGWNIQEFDLPFLIQRSFILSLEVPPDALTPSCYPNPLFIDLMRIWKCGQRVSGKTIGNMGSASLDAVCRACGFPGKPSDCTGAEFASFLRSDDPVKVQIAKDYLASDLTNVQLLADRFGIQ